MQDKEPAASTLCGSFLTLPVLAGYFVVKIRDHFSRPETLADPALRTLLWQADATGLKASPESKIRIDRTLAQEPQGVGIWPAILVYRGDFNISRTAILGSKIAEADITLPEAGYRYNQQFEGQIILQCCAEKEPLTDALQNELMLYFLHYSSAMQQELGVLTLQVVGAGGLRPLPKYTNMSIGQIGIRVAFSHDWLLAEQAPRLGAVDLTLV